MQPILPSLLLFILPIRSCTHDPVIDDSALLLSRTIFLSLLLIFELVTQESRGPKSICSLFQVILPLLQGVSLDMHRDEAEVYEQDSSPHRELQQRELFLIRIMK